MAVCDAQILTNSQSGAIVEYLTEEYDKEAKLSYKDLPNKYLCQQWLAFQISGMRFFEHNNASTDCQQAKARTLDRRLGSHASILRRFPPPSTATSTRLNEPLVSSNWVSNAMAPDGWWVTSAPTPM